MTHLRIREVSWHPRARAELQMQHLHACCYCTPCNMCLIADHHHDHVAMIPDTLSGSGHMATGSMMVTAVKHLVQAAVVAAACQRSKVWSPAVLSCSRLSSLEGSLGLCQSSCVHCMLCLSLAQRLDLHKDGSPLASGSSCSSSMITHTRHTELGTCHVIQLSRLHLQAFKTMHCSQSS